jgi:signal transduction histidine kinase
MQEPISILVIDDEEGIREGMRRVLTREGFQVDLAANGQEAIRWLDEKPYDLALVDLKMPGINGFEVTEYINRLYASRTVVVIVSALATVEAAVEVTRHGAFDFLVKPFTPQDLLEVVRRAIGQQRLLHERENYLTELNSERNLSRQIINSLQEGLVVLNVQQKPVLVNPRAEYLLGIRYREDLQFGDLGLDPEVCEAIRRILASRPQRIEMRMFHLSVGELRLRIQLTPYIRDDQLGGVLILLADVTEEWKVEQDKNRFISMVTHELKSPLAAILNYINVIQSGMFDAQMDKIHQMLERCKIRGEALLDLIRDLLDLNQRQAGKVEKSIEELDLKEILQSQLEFFQVQAQRRGVRLRLEGEAAGGFRVRADRGDLDRIFMNLISNGIKYNREQGDLAITLGRADGFVTVQVRDTGIGMSRPEMESLFQEFYRVKNRKTAGIAGTGLGLATVKRVLAEYNGRISVDSAPDQGTTFNVTLPRAG